MYANFMAEMGGRWRKRGGIAQEVDNKVPEHEEYWKALLEVIEAELVVSLRQEEIDRARLRGDPIPEAPEDDEAGLHAALDTDIHASMVGEGSKPFLHPKPPPG